MRFLLALIPFLLFTSCTSFKCKVEEVGANAMISWLVTPPTKIVFKYDENGMKINDINFESDTEFEFYQEISNVPDLLDQESTGTKLTKDYAFSIVFQNANSDKLVKDIKLNSSKPKVSVGVIFIPNELKF
jgi:hypothetical protein